MRLLVLALALLGVANVAAGQATVVKDEVCAFPNVSSPDGEWILDAPGVSTITPNGIRHLVCWARVPAPGVPVHVELHGERICFIEDAYVSSLEIRISPSGHAMLECWENPGRR